MRVRAWAGTVVFLLVAPGVVAGLVPWVITGWRMPWTGGSVPVVAVVGAFVVLSGVVVLLDAFIRFARADGTPAPPMPTAQLVVVGPYRYVRNPMYLAVLAIILGQALLSRSWGALVYAGLSASGTPSRGVPRRRTGVSGRRSPTRRGTPGTGGP